MDTIIIILVIAVAGFLGFILGKDYRKNRSNTIFKTIDITDKIHKYLEHDQKEYYLDLYMNGDVKLRKEDPLSYPDY